MGCFLAVGSATVLSGLAPEANLIWLANGVLLAYLLLAPRKRWPGYLCAAYAAQLSGSLLTGYHDVIIALVLTLVLILLNLCESLVSALLLRRRSTDLPDFTSPAYIARFVAFGVFAGPALVALVAASISPWHSSSSLWSTSSPDIEFLEWFGTDALGVCVATPACVAIFRTRIRSSLLSLKPWAHLLPVLACTVGAFAQARLPMPFLLYPLLVLVLLRLGLGWAALATLFVAGLATSFTVHGLGPFAATGSITPFASATLLQLFIAAAMVVLYSVSIVIENLRATERRLQEVVAIHNLVTENSRDIILLSDLRGVPTYISPAVSALTGWKPSETMHRGFADVAHPEDLPRIEEAIGSLRSGAEIANVEYRVKVRSGGYVWVESSLRPLHDRLTGVSNGILQIVRDISERKATEAVRQLQRSLIDAIHDVSLDGILVVDHNQNVVSCNRRFGEVWNLDLPECLPGHLEKSNGFPDAQLLSQALTRVKDPELFLERVQDLYVNPDKKDHCEVALNDGRTLERYSTCLRSKDGQYLGRVWFFRDISAHKFAEQQLAEAYHAAETLAVTDALTGLANRRQFDMCLAKEWRRGLRDRTPLSLLIIDADLFKSYNDTYGHLPGDHCLKMIAEATQSVVSRPGDLVARFGGEEFAVVLPNTGISGAMRTAHNVCVAVRNCRLPHSAHPAGIVTVSVGCAALLPQLGQHAAALVDCADKALYEAKRTGRNCVVDYRPADEAGATLRR